MNLSIPVSLLPELHKRKKRRERVRKKLGKSKTVSISNLPSKRKVKAKIAKGKPSDKVLHKKAQDTITVEVPVEDPNKKTLLNEILPEHIDNICTTEDLDLFSVSALKKFCTEHGLAKVGRRSHLVNRVLQEIEKHRPSEEPVDDAEPDADTDPDVGTDADQDTDSAEDVFDIEGNVADSMDDDVDDDEQIES